MLTEAGGRITDTFGHLLDFSLDRTLKNNKGIVATSPGVCAVVSDRLRAARK